MHCLGDGVIWRHLHSRVWCLVRKTQRPTLLTAAHSWPLHGAWVPQSMAAPRWKVCIKKGMMQSFRSSRCTALCYILLDKVVMSLPTFKGMGIGLCFLPGVGEGWGRGYMTEQQSSINGGGLSSQNTICHLYLHNTPRTFPLCPTHRDFPWLQASSYTLPVL